MLLRKIENRCICWMGCVGWGGLLYNNKEGGGVFIQRVGFSLSENINTDELCLWFVPAFQSTQQGCAGRRALFAFDVNRYRGRCMMRLYSARFSLFPFFPSPTLKAHYYGFLSWLWFSCFQCFPLNWCVARFSFLADDGACCVFKFKVSDGRYLSTNSLL